MKYITVLLISVILTVTCQAQYLDEISVKLHKPADLKKDIYLLQNTLEKEHPNLYLYISKKKLTYKFDSLRNTISQPITSIDLYVKLLGVISSIGDGHLTVEIDYSKLSAADIAYLKKPVLQHPIYKFNYTVIAGRIFITGNLPGDSTIIPGTEILSINQVPAAKIIDSLSQYITSDGFNTTYKYFLMNAGLFAERYRFLHPKKEALRFKLQAKEGVRELNVDPFQKPGYDSSGIAPPPNATYKLLTADSNVAYLKLRTFFNGPNYEGYHGIFADIHQKKIQTLILDLRGNTGGEIGWAVSVYSHLIDKPSYFYKLPSEIAQQKILNDDPKISQWLELASKGPQPIITPHEHQFKGKIYVLINGGSFSATSLLASNMKSLKNVTFVGEETGGSKNVWTAGIMKKITLPTSKLLLSYGNIPSYFGDISNIDGRGLMPDIPVTYTIADYLAHKDLEMDWVMKDIDKNKEK